MAKKYRGRNEGSLHRRPNGTWRVQVSLNGKRISQGFHTKSEALLWLRKTQEQIDRGFDLHANKIILGEYLEKWLENARNKLRPKTIDQYQRILAKYILPHLAKIQLKDVRPLLVENFYSKLVQEGVGIRTVRIVHSVLHRSLAQAVRYRILTYNPADGLNLPGYYPKEMQILDESQVSTFLFVAQGSPYYALYLLAITTGMRKGEILGLMWSDIHWHNGRLFIQRQLQKVNGREFYFQEPKTRAGRRTIVLTEAALQALRIFKEKQELHKEFIGERWKENDLVFPSKIGTPMDASNLRLDFNRVLENAGLPHIRFHDLRHTAATLMLNYGVPVITVSKILGHSKPSITLDVYGHMLPEKQAEAARIMDKLVTPFRVDINQSVPEPKFVQKP